MADKRKPESIRPASGLKIKSRVKENVQQKQKAGKMVIQNVNPDVQPDKIEPPTEEAAKVLNNLSKAKEEFMAAMIDFNKLLSDKTLSINKTIEEKKREQEIVSRLIQTSQIVEGLTNSHEAILGLCVFAVRQSLSLRDAGNSLAYELHSLKQDCKKLEEEIKNIKNDIYEASDEKVD